MEEEKEEKELGKKEELGEQGESWEYPGQLSGRALDLYGRKIVGRKGVRREFQLQEVSGRIECLRQEVYGREGGRECPQQESLAEVQEESL